MNYKDISAVWTPPNSSVKIDPNDPAFSMKQDTEEPDTFPAIYLFSNSLDGDGLAYAMAEDGTVLSSHWCSHWGYMRHDLHDRPDRKQVCEKHYPNGYRLVVLLEPGSKPPAEVIARNREQGRS